MSCLQTFPGHTQGPGQGAGSGDNQIGFCQFCSIADSQVIFFFPAYSPHPASTSLCSCVCHEGDGTPQASQRTHSRSLTLALVCAHAHLQSARAVPWIPIFWEGRRVKEPIGFSVGVIVGEEVGEVPRGNADDPAARIPGP